MRTYKEIDSDARDSPHGDSAEQVGSTLSSDLEEGSGHRSSETTPLLVDTLSPDHDTFCYHVCYWLAKVKGIYKRALTPSGEPNVLPAPQPILHRYQSRGVRTAYLHIEVRQMLFAAFFMGVTVIMFSVLYLHAYAARTDLGTPYRVDCGDGVTTLFGRTNHMMGEFDKRFDWRRESPEFPDHIASNWTPVRCPGFCPWRVNRNFSAIHSFGESAKHPPCEDCNNTYGIGTAMCLAAVHSEMVGKYTGGCVSVRVVPIVHKNNTNAQSKLAKNYTVEYRACTRRDHCQDRTLLVLSVTILSVLVCLLLSPPRWLFFGVTMVLGYWYVVLVGAPTYTAVGSNRLDDALGTFPLFVLCTYALHKFLKHGAACNPKTGKYVLDNMLLFVLPFFLMVHMNFAKPFLDFTISPHGLSHLSAVQITVLLALAISIIVIVIARLHFVYLQGVLPTYLIGYSVLFSFITTTTVLAMATSGLSFHLHHYQLALVLLPLVRFPTRMCLFYQGILCGCFVNGVACYGFDSTWVTN